MSLQLESFRTSNKDYFRRTRAQVADALIKEPSRASGAPRYAYFITGDARPDARPIDTAAEWLVPRVAYDEWLFVEGELTAGYYLSRPLRIHLWIEGDEFVADAPMLNTHAFGSSRSVAMDNLGEAIVEHYRHLEQMRDHLAPRMERELKLLQHYVMESDAEL